MKKLLNTNNFKGLSSDLNADTVVLGESSTVSGLQQKGLTSSRVLGSSTYRQSRC